VVGNADAGQTIGSENCLMNFERNKHFKTHLLEDFNKPPTLSVRQFVKHQRCGHRVLGAYGEECEASHPSSL